MALINSFVMDPANFIYTHWNPNCLKFVIKLTCLSRIVYALSCNVIQLQVIKDSQGSF